MFKKTTFLLGTLSTTLLCASAQADWALNSEQSSLYFATVKNATVSEVHHFKKIDGAISDEGKAVLAITLDSVDTANPVRDERMQLQLFETKKFPSAIVNLDLGSEGVKSGVQTITAMLNLHGISKEVSTQVFVEQDDKSITVSSLAPLMIGAPDFGMAKGIEELRDLAKLESISMTVPATFRLVYDKK